MNSLCPAVERHLLHGRSMKTLHRLAILSAFLLCSATSWAKPVTLTESYKGSSAKFVIKGPKAARDYISSTLTNQYGTGGNRDVPYGGVLKNIPGIDGHATVSQRGIFQKRLEVRVDGAMPLPGMHQTLTSSVLNKLVSRVNVELARQPKGAVLFWSN